jgi:hypothetical protein
LKQCNIFHIFEIWWLIRVWILFSVD